MSYTEQQQADERPAQTQDDTARLRLDIKTDDPNVEIHLLATELGGKGNMYRFQFPGVAKVEASLPAGKYSVQIVALNHHPEKLLVDLGPGSTTTHRVQLNPDQEPRFPTFEERLKSYGLSPEQAVQKVELKEREYRRVSSQEGEPGLIRQKAKSLEEVRTFIGAPFGVFDHDEPLFEAVEITQDLRDRLHKNELTSEDHIVLNNLVNEYLHGNEKTNAAVIKEVSPEVSKFLVWHFAFILCNELVIPAGATYEFGPGTLILDRLRIHTTGKLVPRGECKFDIGQWIEFS